MTSHDDIYRKIRTNHRKAKERDLKSERYNRELNTRLELLSVKVKTLYIQISALGALIVGDILSHYIGTK